MNKCRLITVTVILAAFLYGCGEPPPPLNIIRASLSDLPTYSVVLQDMKDEGNFFKDYYHKYRIISEDMTDDFDWMEVSKNYFRRYLPFLGMTIWSKRDGKESRTIGPPGYEYVGHSRYGNWHRDSTGRSFWVFYGQYRLMGDLLGRGPIYRNDYSNYTTHRSKGQPYFGPKKQYGTEGFQTKRQNPNFYKRGTYRKMVKQASFSDRVNKRIGRARSAIRGRSGGRGK